MVEYHGWVSINESTDGETEGNIDSIIKQVNALIDSIYALSRLIDLQPINGHYFLHFAGLTNHITEELNDVANLCMKIGEIAPGSYGLIYTRNDEQPDPENNNFIVYRLARGKMTIEVDNLLSPCNPTIED